MRKESLRASDDRGEHQAAAEQERKEPRIRTAFGLDFKVTLARNEIPETSVVATRSIARRRLRRSNG